jgi:hypothetical protein
MIRLLASVAAALSTLIFGIGLGGAMNARSMNAASAYAATSTAWVTSTAVVAPTTDPSYGAGHRDPYGDRHVDGGLDGARRRDAAQHGHADAAVRRNARSGNGDGHRDCDQGE